MGQRWVSNGTNGSSTMYLEGSSGTYYSGDGGGKLTVGDPVSITPINTAATVRIGTAVTLYESGSGTKYDRGDAISGYPAVSSGGNVYYLAEAAKTYYKQGSVDSDTYYTKS